MTDQAQRLKNSLADRYEIQSEAGTGGMAIVYLARDVKHDRPVAVKVLRPELAATLGTERFLQEIKVTANLQHPHILPLHDSGNADGLLYYVMPYVEGESLRDRLRRETQLPVREAVSIAVAVASALDYAHRRDVVHRDVKPENILFLDGEAVVTDFGIALAVAEAGGERLTDVGLSVGTPSYMSPEQAMGQRDIDGRTDIYALASLLFEMLGGDPPFTGDTVQAVLTRVITESPPPIRSLRASVPLPLDKALRKALAKKPEERYQTAAAFAKALSSSRGSLSKVAALSQTSKRWIGVAVVAVIVLLGLAAYRISRGAADRTWARAVAIPTIDSLLGEARFAEASVLTVRALNHLPDDPTLQAYRARSTLDVNVASDPPGARVLFRGYSQPDSAWQDAGLTPLEAVAMPYGYARIRLELAGHRTYERAINTVFESTLDLRITPNDEPDMVWVPGGSYAFADTAIPLDSFRIDRHEVTNAEFQEFIDDGGYETLALWTNTFVRGTRQIPSDEAVDGFLDGTGRPGPATWELGRFASGEDNYPVTGVSWYEAAAYCAFAGKSLPTYYHWKQAVGSDPWDDILNYSNFGDAATAVTSTGGVGPYGAFDMAGNAREWVSSATGDLRYILGGAWNEAEYLFQDRDAIDPWSREPTNGFRCAVYDAPPPAHILAPIERPYFDFSDVEPADDEAYEIFKSFYAYQPIDLDATRTVEDTTSDWIKERVEFTAAYGDERVIAYVFLPTNATPPYQSVIYFPSGAAFGLRSSENLAEMEMVNFIPRSGRALVYPILKGMYERNIENRRPGLPALRQRTVWATQDLLRTVDYVMARDDLRNEAVSYMGLSLGAELAIPVALEKRFRALVLVGGALDQAWRGNVLPEASPWNFVSRITTPTLLINGRHDFMHPYETGQVPFFDAINVPDEQKEFVVLDAGHIPPWNDVIRHTLDWLDQYLGPVR